MNLKAPITSQNIPKSNLPRNRSIRVCERQNLTYQQQVEIIDFYHKTEGYLNLVKMVEHLRKDLPHQIGLDGDSMRLDVHPDVYWIIDALSRDPPTEELPSDEQLLQGAHVQV
jgi:hypothetical protein